MGGRGGGGASGGAGGGVNGGGGGGGGVDSDGFVGSFMMMCVQILLEFRNED